MALSERRSSQTLPYELFTPSPSTHRARDQSTHANVPAKWKDDDVISLLHVPEAALRLKSLDYESRAPLYGQIFEMDIQSLRITLDALRNPSARQFLGRQSLLASRRWPDLLHDYKHMLEETRQNSDQFEVYEM